MAVGQGPQPRLDAITNEEVAQVNVMFCLLHIVLVNGFACQRGVLWFFNGHQSVVRLLFAEAENAELAAELLKPRPRGVDATSIFWVYRQIKDWN